MSHTITEKKKLLARVRRIRGQVDAIERALDTEAGCEEVLPRISLFNSYKPGSDA